MEHKGLRPLINPRVFRQSHSGSAAVFHCAPDAVQCPPPFFHRLSTRECGPLLFLKRLFRLRDTAKPACSSAVPLRCLPLLWRGRCAFLKLHPLAPQFSRKTSFPCPARRFSRTAPSSGIVRRRRASFRSAGRSLNRTSDRRTLSMRTAFAAACPQSHTPGGCRTW